MKKWTRLFAVLLSLSLFCMSGMSAMATTDISNTDISQAEDGETDQNPNQDETEDDEQGTGKGETPKKPYPAGTETILGEDPYTYKIRIFSGKQGTFQLGSSNESGEDEEIKDENADGNENEINNPDSGNADGSAEGADGSEDAGDIGNEEEVPAGIEVLEFEIDPDQFTGDPQIILNYLDFVQLNGKGQGYSIKLNDNSKYYVMGIRESGRDNNTVGAITVTGDKDYVIAYGLRGKMVNYTVEFVDQAGNMLAAPQTYEGKVGDKPVVAYLYIDGYRPQAYNLTKTLEEDASKNVIQFVYSPATTPAGTVTGTGGEFVTLIDNGTTIGGGGGAGGIIDEGTTVIEGGGAGAGGADAGGAGDAGVTIEDEPTPLGAPEELIDLDDEDVPLAGGGGLFGTDGNADLLGIPLPVIILIGGVMAGGLWYAFVYRKKKKEQEQEETES